MKLKQKSMREPYVRKESANSTNERNEIYAKSHYYFRRVNRVANRRNEIYAKSHYIFRFPCTRDNLWKGQRFPQRETLGKKSLSLFPLSCTHGENRYI